MLPKLLKFIAYMSSGGHPVLGFPACMLALDLPKRKHKSGRIATCAIRGQPLLLASQEPWAVALAPGIPRYIIHKLVCSKYHSPLYKSFPPPPHHSGIPPLL